MNRTTRNDFLKLKRDNNFQFAVHIHPLILFDVSLCSSYGIVKYCKNQLIEKKRHFTCVNPKMGYMVAIDVHTKLTVHRETMAAVKLQAKFQTHFLIGSEIFMELFKF
jgi:hypothetical protein